jgi:hypothetical protein
LNLALSALTQIFAPHLVAMSSFSCRSNYNVAAIASKVFDSMLKGLSQTESLYTRTETNYTRLKTSENYPEDFL